MYSWERNMFKCGKVKYWLIIDMHITMYSCRIVSTMSFYMAMYGCGMLYVYLLFSKTAWSEPLIHKLIKLNTNYCTWRWSSLVNEVEKNQIWQLSRQNRLPPPPPRNVCRDKVNYLKFPKHTQKTWTKKRAQKTSDGKKPSSPPPHDVFIATLYIRVRPYISL